MPQIDHATLAAMRRAVNAALPDAEEDWEEQQDRGRVPEQHPYLDLLVVDSYLAGVGLRRS